MSNQILVTHYRQTNSSTTLYTPFHNKSYTSENGVNEQASLAYKQNNIESCLSLYSLVTMLSGLLLYLYHCILGMFFFHYVSYYLMRNYCCLKKNCHLMKNLHKILPLFEN